MYIFSNSYRKICVLIILSFSLIFISGCKNEKPPATSSPSPSASQAASPSASPKASSSPQPSPSVSPGTTPTPTPTANTIGVTGLSIDKEILNLIVGDSTTLTVAVEPSGATRKTIIWESSNESVVSVSQTSDTTVTVTGKSTGTVLITAESEEGGKLAASIISVNNNAEVTTVNLNQKDVYLTVGSTAQIIATVLPENATNKKLSWTSSAPNIAMASEDGTITAIGIGTAVITVKSLSGNKTTTCNVHVKEAVTAISVKPSAQSMKIGEKLTLTVNIAPSTADRPNLVWTSSNPAIASVSNGNITAVGVGETIITATTDDGKLSSSCTIYVSR